MHIKSSQVMSIQFHELNPNMEPEPKAGHQRIDAFELVLEKTLESPLDCKKIQPVHPKGDQS